MATIDPRNIARESDRSLIRSATPDDASEMLRLRQRLCSETEFMSREPGEMTATLESQRAHIVERTAAEHDLLLVAVVADKLVGILGFNSRPLARFRHQGEFGIGVLQDFWGGGIGGALLTALCDRADGIPLVSGRVVAHERIRRQRTYDCFEAW